MSSMGTSHNWNRNLVQAKQKDRCREVMMIGRAGRELLWMSASACMGGVAGSE